MLLGTPSCSGALCIDLVRHVVRPDVCPVTTSALSLASRIDVNTMTEASMMAVGQHAVRAGESIYVPTWTRPQEGESIFVQKMK